MELFRGVGHSFLRPGGEPGADGWRDGVHKQQRRLLVLHQVHGGKRPHHREHTAKQDVWRVTASWSYPRQWKTAHGIVNNREAAATGSGDLQPHEPVPPRQQPGPQREHLRLRDRPSQRGRG